MPRPAKAIRRQLIDAGIEYKKGNRQAAYAAWAKVAAARKDRYESKNNKKARAAAEAAAKESSE